MRKLHFLIVFFLFVLVSVNVKAQSPCVMSYEPNETVNDCYWLNDLSAPANQTIVVNAGIDNSSDVDFYRFEVTRVLSNIRITLRDLPKSYGIILYMHEAWGEPRLIDYNLNYGTSDKTIILNGAPNLPYYIKIFSPFGEYDENRCYTLEIDIRKP
ncbi:MAG: hypothetical protein E6772_08020 [Dysgonomonas sp.]|nr:hypothetical protein [Dysgonomonas sp.]